MTRHLIAGGSLALIALPGADGGTLTAVAIGGALAALLASVEARRGAALRNDGTPRLREDGSWK